MGQTTCRWALVGNIHVITHLEEPPTDEEWTAYFADMERKLSEIGGLYVYTLGAGPNAAQREVATNFWGDKPVRIAVVSPAAVVRGIVTAVRWFLGSKMKAFSPNETDAAFAYLEVADPAQRRAVLETVRRFHTELVEAHRSAPGRKLSSR